MSRCKIIRATAIAALLCGAATAQAQNTTAADELAIAKQGYLFAGGKYQTIDGKQVMAGQVYAEFQIPKQRTHPDPIVMVHGAIQTGTNFTGTPDGRMGWAEYFLRHGYAVYVIDQPGRARASYNAAADGAQAFPDLLNTEQRFTAPERYKLWPQARLHSQWPGSGMAGDPIFDQFYASQVPFVQAAAKAQAMTRDALVALLEKIGPAIVMTHSQSGSMGWLTADARPDLVRALIQVEPSGPPVHDVLTVGAPEYLRDGDAVRPVGAGRDPAELCARREQPRRTVIRAAGQSRWAGSCALLDAKGAGAATAQSRENADADRQWRSIISRAVRTLHGQIPAAGGRESRVDRSRQGGHSRQRPHDDAGEKQSRHRRRHRPLGDKVRPRQSRSTITSTKTCHSRHKPQAEARPREARRDAGPDSIAGRRVSRWVPAHRLAPLGSPGMTVDKVTRRSCSVAVAVWKRAAAVAVR